MLTRARRAKGEAFSLRLEPGDLARFASLELVDQFRCWFLRGASLMAFCNSGSERFHLPIVQRSLFAELHPGGFDGIGTTE